MMESARFWEALIAICAVVCIVGGVVAMYVKGQLAGSMLRVLTSPETVTSIRFIVRDELGRFEARMESKGYVTTAICLAHREAEVTRHLEVTRRLTVLESEDKEQHGKGRE